MTNEEIIKMLTSPREEDIKLLQEIESRPRMEVDRAKCAERARQFVAAHCSFTIEDVTPEGYGN